MKPSKRTISKLMKFNKTEGNLLERAKEVIINRLLEIESKGNHYTLTKVIQELTKTIHVRDLSNNTSEILTRYISMPCEYDLRDLFYQYDFLNSKIVTK